jgi:hypothetical protein
MLVDAASFIVVAILLGAALGWLLIHLAAGPDPPAQPQTIIRRDGRKDGGLFRAKTWRKGKAPPVATRRPANYNRPADIELAEDRVVDPPRPVEGVNGE